jgi:hypothetical protein
MRRRTAVLLYLAVIAATAVGLAAIEAKAVGWSKVTVVGVLLQLPPIAVPLGVVLAGFLAFSRRRI